MLAEEISDLPTSGLFLAGFRIVVRAETGLVLGISFRQYQAEAEPTRMST